MAAGRLDDALKNSQDAARLDLQSAVKSNDSTAIGNSAIKIGDLTRQQVLA